MHRTLSWKVKVLALGITRVCEVAVVLALYGVAACTLVDT
mgnify:CR=1 FL=1